MRDPNQQFFDTFLLVVGILIGVTVFLFLTVSNYAIGTQGEYVLSDPTVQAAINERIEPVGHVILAGSEELAAARAAPMANPERVATVLTGPQVFNEACFACHSPPGVGGAPVVGDAAAWSDRVAQGMDVLTDHALNGYQGNSGFMPAKGGRPDLSDDEIVSAIEYMVGQLEP